MERVELGDLLLIAEIHTGIEAECLARMDRVVTLAQSALAAPFAGFGGVELFSTFEDKAAIYCARLVTYHPLPDGNKRAAYDVMIESHVDALRRRSVGDRHDDRTARGRAPAGQRGRLPHMGRATHLPKPALTPVRSHQRPAPHQRSMRSFARKQRSPSGVLRLGNAPA